jgi:hypothetical protein
MAEDAIRQSDFAAFRRAWDSPHTEPYVLLDIAITRFNTLLRRCICSDALLEKWSITGMESKMRGVISIISFLKHQSRAEPPSRFICEGVDRPFLVMALFNGVCVTGVSSSPCCPLNLRNKNLQNLLSVSSVSPTNPHKRVALLLLFVVDRLAEVVEIVGKKFLAPAQELCEHLMALAFATGHDRGFRYLAAALGKFPVLYDWEAAIHFVGTDTDGCLEALVGMYLKQSLKFPGSEVLSSPRMGFALPAISALRPAGPISDESISRCSDMFGKFAVNCLTHKVKNPIEKGLGAAGKEAGRKEIPAAIFLADMRSRVSRRSELETE